MNRTILLFLTLLSITSMVVGQPQVTIRQIQETDDPSGNSPYAGTAVIAGGIVIGVDFGGLVNRYYIADRTGGIWSGIYVNDTQDRQLSVGDSVSFQASVQESNTQTRLWNIVSTTYITVPASGDVPSVIIQTGSVDESTEGCLIRLENVTVTEINGDEFIVDDGSGPVTIGSGWDYLYAPLMGDELTSITGIVSSAASEYTVNPRGDADFGFIGNRPPLISQVAHTPEIPTELDPVTITAVITDDSSVAEAYVHYRFGEEGTFSTQQMFDDGNHGDGAEGDDVWGGILPAGPARTMAYYYIEATDNEEETGYSPPDAPATLYDYSIRGATLMIYDLQYTGNPTGGSSPYVDSTVAVTGIVIGTEFSDYRDGFFISDPGGGPWSGILVYDPSLTPALGDSVRVTGQITEHYEITEFTAGARVEVLGTGTIPEPWPIRADEMQDSAEAYEGILAKLDTCRVTSISDWNSYGQFDINDGTGTGTILNDFGFEYEPAIGDSFTHIIGCVTYHSSPGHMVAPRFDEDLGYIDRRPPEVVSTSAVLITGVNVRFNERLSPAQTGELSNYRLTNVSDPEFPELHIESALLFTDGRTIHLETLEQLENETAYRLEIVYVEDVAGNSLEEFEVGFMGYEPVEYTQIADIYNNYRYYADSVVIVKLCGVVNFMQDVTTTSGSRRISAYIQDNSGRGFSLSQTGPASEFPDIQRGNLIEITGTVSDYEGVIQLGGFSTGNPSPDIVKLNEGAPLPEPILLKTGDLRLQNELIRTSEEGLTGAGTWVQVSGTIYRVDENVGGGTNMYIDDGTGNVTIRIWDSMNLRQVTLDGVVYPLRDLAGVICSVAGPASTYLGDFQMLAGYDEDFFVTPLDVPPSDHLILEVPNRPFAPDLGQKFTIFYNTPTTGSVRLRVFDLRGHVVVTLVNKEAGGPNEIEWDGRDDLNNIVPLGTYILHLEYVHSGDSDTEVRPIVVGTKL